MQIADRPFQTFMGSRVFVDRSARTKLPFQKPDAPYPVWKVLKNLIGKDVTKISMPV